MGTVGAERTVTAAGSPHVGRGAPRPRRVRTTFRWSLVVLGLVLTTTVLLTAVGPRFLPFRTFYVRSGSMAPTLPVGSLAFYEPVDGADLHAGDIIVFSRPGSHGRDLVTHRIVRVERRASGRVFVTKGDANGAADGWRVPARGEGWRYRFAVPYVGYAAGVLGSSLGRVWLGMIGIVAAAVVLLVELWRPRRPAISVP